MVIENTPERKKDIDTAKLLGAKSTSKVASILYEAIPGLEDIVKAKKDVDSKQFEAIQKQHDFYASMVKEKQSTVKLYSDLAQTAYQAGNTALGDRYMGLAESNLPTQDDIEQKTRLENQMNDMVRGISKQQAQAIQAEQPISFSEKFEMKTSDFIDALNDPSKLQKTFDRLIELGDSEAANNFAKMVSENMSGNFTNNLSPDNPLSQPQQSNGNIEPPQNPDSIGEDVNPIDNIMKNIKSKLSGNKSNDASETVNDISSSLKSSMNRGGI